MELMGLATPDSLTVFCFCLVIIAVLVAGSTKPSSLRFDDVGCDVFSCSGEESFRISDDVSSPVEKEATCSIAAAEQEKGEEEDGDATAAAAEEEEEASSLILEINEEEEEEEGDDVDDDELRRKVEEFIAKINSGWRAEKLLQATTITTV
ncbi:hypothetical protein M569_00880 [Genlisea aurea]|uniref:Uncharacterized protein n=1 Tax=Genlisea aurea TaxID=192259 RepID=S8D3F6_9LAMI|nr:hypothetical protein M569_00880 [Genlisea aurea]